jgi:hemin uptake protein HemP
MQSRSPGPASPVPSPEPTAPVASATRRIRSEQLLSGGNELVIEHHGREYRLRVTQNGKLILTA